MYSEEQIDAAVAALNRKALRALHIVSILQAVKRSPAAGRTFSKALLPTLEAALPGCRVDVWIRDYCPDRPRVLSVSWQEGERRESFDVEVATKTNTRLTAETLEARISWYKQIAADCMKSAESLLINAMILNQAEPYLSPIRCAVEHALECARYTP